MVGGTVTNPAPVVLSLRLPPDLVAALDATADAYRVPRSVVVRSALTGWALQAPPMLPPVTDDAPAP